MDPHSGLNHNSCSEHSRITITINHGKDLSAATDEMPVAVARRIITSAALRGIDPPPQLIAAVEKIIAGLHEAHDYVDLTGETTCGAFMR